MQVTPAILTDSFATFQRELESVRYSSAIEAVQIDVIDGLFADNITVTPIDLTVAEFDPLKIDLHLMTEEPMDFVYEAEGLKEYLPIRRIYGQIERMSHQVDFLQEVKTNVWQAGLALNIFTPLEEIKKEVWADLKYVLLMSVEAGWQAQTFNKLVLDKIKRLREQFPKTSDLHILVDGGITLENVAEVMKAGADEVAIGNAIWKSNDPIGTIEDFLSLSAR